MLMKNVRRYLGAIGLLLLMGVVTSCIKDDIATTETGTANITVNISSRSGEVDNDNSEVLANEDIKTIRLILVQNGKVVSNSKHSFTAPDGQKLLEQGIRIVGVKKAATDFYAVVNEEDAFGLDDLETCSEDILNKVFNGFPCEYSKEISLPMYGKVTNQVIEDDGTVSVFVTRAVARIDFKITNNTDNSIYIKNINFGQFFANKGYLVNNSSKESDIIYNPKSFDVKEGMINANGGSNTFVYYLYEANVPYENYQVGMITADGFNYTLKQIDVPEENRNKLLKRNTILRINAYVNVDDNQGMCATINCTLEPWSAVDLDPTFE